MSTVLEYDGASSALDSILEEKKDVKLEFDVIALTGDGLVS